MDTSEKEQYVKFLANYLRKSRGEDESHLDKHRIQLKEMCERKRYP
jgi:hypothetical protein